MEELANKKEFDQESLNIYHESKQKCEICEKVFKTKQELKHHFTAVHLVNNEKVYNCNICRKLYTSRTLLIFHINTVHKDHKDYKQ